MHTEVQLQKCLDCTDLGLHEMPGIILESSHDHEASVYQAKHIRITSAILFGSGCSAMLQVPASSFEREKIEKMHAGHIMSAAGLGRYVEI